MLQEADEEYEVTDPSITTGLDFHAQPALKRILARAERTNSFAATAALLEIANDAGLDGVWWNETLDPYGLSAPRGAIHRAKLNRWTVSQIPEYSVEEDWE